MPDLSRLPYADNVVAYINSTVVPHIKYTLKPTPK